MPSHAGHCFAQPEPAEELKAHLKKNLKGTKLQVESYLEGEYEYSIEAPAVTADILAERSRTPLSIDALRGEAKAHLKRRFPQLQGYIEFANGEIEYSDANGNPVVTKFRVR